MAVNTIRSHYYALIFESLLKGFRFIPKSISFEIKESLDLLASEEDRPFDPPPELAQAYVKLHALAQASSLPGERLESYVSILDLLDFMTTLRGFDARERAVFDTIRKLIETDAGPRTSARGRTSGEKGTLMMKLTKYQRVAFDLVRAAIDAGEPLTFVTGAKGTGRSVVLYHVASLYDMAIIECAEPSNVNLSVQHVNARLAKIAEDITHYGSELRIVVLSGAEVLFSPDIPLSARVAIPQGMQVIALIDTTSKYSQTILSDDMRFFGRKAAVVDLPAPTKEQLVEVYERKHPTASVVVDRLASRGAPLSFDAVKRILAVAEKAGLDEAVAVVTGRTGDVFREGRTEPTPSGVMDQIRTRVFSQDEALLSVQRVLKRNHAGMKPEGRLAGAFLFAGPTGTGKTETAIAMAECLHIPILRIDLSEYAMPHTIQRLIGAPPSYIGYNDGAILVDFIKKHPQGVILLDEAEKASREVTQLFLGILDSGILKTQKGDNLDASGHWLVFTTNAGMRDLADRAPRMGFLADDAPSHGKSLFTEDSVQASRAGVEAEFAPEFRNRLDAVVYYKPLSPHVAHDVVRKFVKTLALQVKARKNIEIIVTENVTAHIASIGYNERDGARALRRTSEREISEKVADLEPQSGDQVTVELSDGVITARISAKAEQKTEIPGEETAAVSEAEENTAGTGPADLDSAARKKNARRRTIQI